LSNIYAHGLFATERAAICEVADRFARHIVADARTAPRIGASLDVKPSGERRT
jgi:hypothetical protein